MEGIWKDIEGYEGKYQVSNLGNVRSLNYNNTGKPKNLKPKINRYGYKEVKLSKFNKTKNYLVSTLVDRHFHKNINGGTRKMKEIKVTNNYGLFNKLEGNRITSISRINKIKNSILNVGYITSPILVNEKMEIIDGQGRFEALKNLQMPIEYIIQENIGIKECIAMNVNQTNWDLLDYIKSYADKGVQSYIYFMDLIKEFPKFKGLGAFTISLFNLVRPDAKKLKDGNLIITAENYEQAREKLNFVYELKQIYSNVKRVDLVIKGVLYCLNMEEVDKELLKKKVIEVLEANKVPPVPTIEETMQFLEALYNKNRKGNTIYIYTEYRKGVEARAHRGIEKIYENYYKKEQ